MKIQLYSSLLILFAIISSPVNVQAQSQSQTPQNYVVLTKNLQQLQPIFLTASALAQEDGASFGKFEVIICGKTVEELKDKEAMQPYIEKAKQIGVELVICGISLDKFSVDTDDISQQLRVVDNGILYNLQLQKKGYTSISI